MPTKNFLSLCILILLMQSIILNHEAKSESEDHAYIPPPLTEGMLDDRNAQNSAPHIIQQPAEPAFINGKPASELSDDELRDFLETKIQTVEQEEGQIELLKIAPGYALTLTFDESVQSVVLGDSALVSYHLQTQRTLVLAATQREGDTSMTLIMPGGKLLNYHIFIASDFIEAQTSLKVISNTNMGSESLTSESGGNAFKNSLYTQSDGTPNIKNLIYTIANYDALLQEKAIDRRAVKRMKIFKKSDLTSFTVYYLYQFASGPIIITFSYYNSLNYSVRYDESRLRVQLGNMQFVPDYTTLHKTVLRPNETTTGIAIVNTPALRVPQPFELIWK